MALSCRKKLKKIVVIAFIPLEKKLELHKNICVNKDFWNVIMPYEETKILEFNQYQKYDKTPFIIYAVYECIIEKIDEYKNNS